MSFEPNSIVEEEYMLHGIKERKKFNVKVDAHGHIPMYVWHDGKEYKSVPKWNLAVINSTEFFASGHESRVKFTKYPLDGSDFPYGVT